MSASRTPRLLLSLSVASLLMASPYAFAQERYSDADRALEESTMLASTNADATSFDFQTARTTGELYPAADRALNAPPVRMANENNEFTYQDFAQGELGHPTYHLPADHEGAYTATMRAE